MSPRGVLVTLPTESIAVRALIASVVAILLARMLLGAGLRVPRVRVLATLLPVVSLGILVAISWQRLDLPSLMVATEGRQLLSVPVDRGYVHFAPLAIPLLATIWLAIAGMRISRRLRSHACTVRLARGAVGTVVAWRVRFVAGRVARSMGVTMPTIAEIDDVAGGAAVVGVRRPVLVVDRDLSRNLDEDELEAVLAHELAHIRRRDNLLAVLIGIARDLTWFLPGGGWAVGRLRVEREFAADQLAAATTSRPAALASGLLKVMTGSAPPEACAALVDGSTVVHRVELLIDERPEPGRGRRSAERGAVFVAVMAVVAAAIALPATIKGTDGARDAWAVMVMGPGAAEVTETEAVMFDVYRRTALRTTTRSTAGVPVIDDDPNQVRPGALRACGTETGSASCPARRPAGTLGLRPQPVVRVDADLVRRWHAHPVGSPARGLAFVVLARVPPE